jgi:NitT/TauT family transport system substrate-binding protein
MARIFAAALAALLALAAPLAPAGAADKLALKLDWSVYGPHAPFFLGLVKGFYRDEGIDLTINEGNSSGNVVRLVGAGTDPLAFIDMGTMAIGASNGMPIQAVFGVHQRNPMVIISRADAPVKTPKELEGMVIAMAPSESTALRYPALLARNHVDAGKISVINPAVGAKNALLLQKRTDAVTGVSYFALPFFKLHGMDVTSFSYADHGVTALEDGIVVNTDWAKDHADLLRRFLKASVKAWTLAKQDPAGAVDAILSVRPDRKADRELLLQQLTIGLTLLQSPNTAGMPLGQMSQKDWEAMIDVMGSTGLIKTKLPVERYYTNDYNPG